jgi:DNA-binding NtrC family response regulator
MTAREKKSSTILHFGSDRAALLLRARNLKRRGYEVLNSTNGFEAIQLACLEVVDAVVLDQDGNGAEVELVATEIKRCRPQVPTILLAEGAGPQGRTQELADALVKRENLRMLVAALEDVLCERLPRTEAASE